MAIKMKFHRPSVGSRGCRHGDRRRPGGLRTFATRPISSLRRSGLSPLPPLVGVACTGNTFTTSYLQRRRY